MGENAASAWLFHPIKCFLEEIEIGWIAEFFALLRQGYGAAGGLK
jgi:hypothetical protein